jgi:hypothetical protein
MQKNNIIFIMSLYVCAFYFYKHKLNNFLIIICTIGLYFVLFRINNDIYIENLTSDEAIQNLSSMYNSETLRAKNLELTGNLTVNGII